MYTEKNGEIVYDICEGIINEEVDRDGKASLRDDGYPGTQSAMSLIIAAFGGRPPVIADRRHHIHDKRTETSVILCISEELTRQF